MELEFLIIKVWIRDGSIWDEFSSTFFKHKEGWYFKTCFTGCEFTAKNGWILKYDFNMFMWVWIYNGKEWLNFRACFSYICEVWIYSTEWVNFEACFSYVCRVWIYGNEWLNLKYVFHMFTGCEFLMKNGYFKVYFLYIYGVNFLQRLDVSYCVIYLCYWSTSINYGPLASIINLPNYKFNLIKINNHNRSCILIEVTVEAGSRSTI